jgi:phage terminase large subunit
MSMATEQTRAKVTLPFAPRPWQKPLIDDPAKRIVAVVHRRAGKSTALMWRGFKRALTDPKPLPRVVHILPYGVMWSRTGLWDQAVRAADAIPGAVVRRSEMAIKLPNGGTWQAGGADNPDSWRGGYADECIIDEFDDTPQSMVPLVIEPMLADRDGTLVRSGTPKGRGLLQAAYDRARTTPGYSAYLLDHTRTNALSAEAIERLRTEMSDEEFEQELCCSFNAPNSGSYYGKLMDEVERTGRITSVPHDPAMKVWTAWDLGVHDSTAIWCCQVTKGGEWRLIDYIEDSGAGLDHYVRLLQQRPYVYERHILPHDAAVRELGSGKSRIETLHSLGVRPTRQCRAHSVADGINAVRMILPRAWFDAERCAKGISALRHYRREWNEAAQTWRSAPVHDHASHGADAARYLALGVRDTEAPTVDIISGQLPTRKYLEPRGLESSWMGI